ncbi:MAG: hypothetical protein BGO51_28340 [Rhodospirillales bacterium 69-11]|nr:hypothetical protein [Rhodospirillales bacterium]MBN8907260.1 hypothetical protein [Rhodospirillales bacterium]MBN8925778.1 hypothetical protein [Rhodospirillales bacterium]OJW25216.1 MAG: hypothetical protein BGO51_28340 [Rhodospirillales bacterium 69-11]
MPHEHPSPELARPTLPLGDCPETVRLTFGVTAEHGGKAIPCNSSLHLDELTWPPALLAESEIGAKEGRFFQNFTYAAGQPRRSEFAERADTMTFDVDTGLPWETALQACEKHGVAAVAASSYNWGKRVSRYKAADYHAWREEHPETAEADAPAGFMGAIDGLHPSVTAGASVRGEFDGKVEITHGPIEKYRLTLPLARPWLRSDFPTLAAAAENWAGLYWAVAAALGIAEWVDPTCDDLSRFYYLPRRCADAEHASEIIPGRAVLI